MKPRSFVKYANRKMHEQGSEESYVSMAELGDIIASGAEVEVIDDATGEDLTLVVMARILYDLCRRDVETCEPKVLQRIIVASRSKK